MRFTVFEIFILIGLIQVIFLVSSLIRIENKSRYSGNYLIAFLVLNAIMLGSALRFSFNGYAEIEHWTRFLDVLQVLYGPFVYAYFMQSTSEAKYRMNKYHFIPVTLGVIMLLGINFKLFESQMLKNIFDFRLVLAASMCLIYWVAANIHLFKIYGAIEKISKRYIFTFSISIALFAVMWLGTVLAYKITNQGFGIFNFDIVLITLCLPTYIIGFYGIAYPKTFRQNMVKTPSVQPSLLTTEKIQQVHFQIKNQMIEKKLYLNPKLTLNQLAEALNISSNKLSWFLNNELNTTFYKYINQFRIEEFKSMIQNDKHKSHTILALSMDSGFNSKSTFNKTFKLITDETPSNYVKNYDLEK